MNMATYETAADLILVFSDSSHDVMTYELKLDPAGTISLIACAQTLILSPTSQALTCQNPSKETINSTILVSITDLSKATGVTISQNPEATAPKFLYTVTLTLEYVIIDTINSTNY